ncbi:phage head-tail joining protein [Shimia ponticola]|uniref:phage head-tail joining protein n=1 Tax=Shimia ponticola TaxID=2582893 RepID=UPI0011BDB20C|nr:hypothetical protein [Shimia ponticola]
MSTAAQLARLKDMYAKGVLSLEQGGEKVSFADGRELRTRIADLERQLQAEQGMAGAQSGISYPAYDRGTR